MMQGQGRALCDPVLEATGVLHGFGERGVQVPESTVFPRQVHGICVVRAEVVSGAERGEPVEADAIVSATPGLTVGIVTADCVPILVASRDGSRVGAIHAGWRGLAAGVIEAGIEAMDCDASGLAAAVGPAARGCCYEVDEPVARALAVRYANLLEEVLVPGRSGHFQLDLPRLASRILGRVGLDPEQLGSAHRLCTICTPGPRFESYRRDGRLAGRLRHFIRPAAGPAAPRRAVSRSQG
jgi:hypothetical protein